MNDQKGHYTESLANNKIKCSLCPHHCVISPGKTGKCLTRQNKGGTLIATNYCRPVSMAIDPVEKKPLYHFFPGSKIFSLGPNGCNFRCDFCQNWEIAQKSIYASYIPAQDLAQRIIESGTIGVAYTYSEPYTWYETIMDVGPIIKKHGLANIMVTNGFMEPGPLQDLLTIIDAMNIDIKSMDTSFYKKVCKGELNSVLRTCEQVKKNGCHLEITALLITGENDSEKDIQTLVKFVAHSLGKETPLHFSRFFPSYLRQGKPTTLNSLHRAYGIAREKLDNVYVGGSPERSITACPSCKENLIIRNGYQTEISTNLIRGPNPKCGKCGMEINVVF